MKALRRQLGGYRYWFRPDSSRSSFRAALRAKLLARWSASTVITIVTVASTLSPALFIGMFGGYVQAASGSVGPRSATASGDCVEDASAGTAVWTSPGNAFSDNSTYAAVSVDGTSSRYIKCTNYGFSIPTGVTIAGIVVTLERRSDSTGNGGSSDAAVRIVKGGTIGATDKSTATTYTTSDVKEDHGSSSDLWGETLTASDVNASNFGAAIRVQKASAAGAAHNISVDVVQITVHYTFNPTFEQSSYRWFNNTDAAELSFAKVLGGASNDNSYSIIQTSDDGYVITGYTSSYGAGSSDLLLTKFDKYGVEQWTKTLGNTSIDQGQSVVEISDGSIVVAGGTESYGAGARDVILSKFNSSGVEQWTKTIGTTSADEALSLIETSDNGFVVTGYYGASTDTLLSKFNSSGVEQWTKTLAADTGSAVVETADGGFAVFGQTNNFGAGSDDLTLVKYNSSGVEQWTKALGTTSLEQAGSLLEDSSGNLITAGYTAGFSSGGDFMLSKFNSSGVEQWTKTLGGAGSEVAYDMVETTGGDFVLTGSTTTYGNGSGDVMISKFNSSGVEQWTKTIGGSGAESGRSIIEVPDGFAVVGNTASYGAGNADIFLVKFDSTGTITSCSSECTSQSITETDRSLTEADQTLTETNQTVTETNQTVTESNQTISESAVIGYPPADVGSALNGVSQDTATTALAEGVPFRLRMTLHVGTDPALDEGSFAFKLQYALKSGTCDTGFSGETYADVTTSTSIAYYDNTNAVDGTTLTTNANDPVHSGHTNVSQDYNEANNASVIADTSSGQDGLWDFALTDNGAPASTDYCFRLVTSAGATLNTYSVVPMITTLPPDFDQTNYRWFKGQDAVPNNTFLHALGGASADYGYAVAPTSDNGYVVTGQTQSYGTAGDLWLAKFDSTGTEEWTKSLGGASPDVGLSVIQSRDGGYVVTGYTSSLGAGNEDLWLIKFSSAGVEQWTKTLGGSGTDAGQSVVQTSDSGYIVTGYTGLGAGNFDLWLVKFDSSGTEQWTKTLGGTFADFGQSVIQTLDGGYAVAGYTANYGAGGTDLWLAKFDSSGTEQWTKTLGGSLDEQGHFVMQASDGGYIAGGYTMSLGAGDEDAIIAKLDSTGTEEWTKTLGGFTVDVGRAFTRTSDGGFAMTGNSDVLGSGLEDLWVSKFDSSGIEQWTKIVAGGLSDAGYGIAQTVDGGYAAAGYTQSYGAGSIDLWLAKLDYSGDINSCSALICNTADLTESNQTVTESNQSLTESNQTVTESNQSVSEVDRTSNTTTNIQAGNVGFAVTIGSSGSDTGLSIAPSADGDGGYVVSGTSPVGFSGSLDMMLAKFDPVGTELWTKSLGAPSSNTAETGSSVYATSDDGYVVLGRTQSTGSGDLWLSKFNSSGVEQWTQGYGTASNETPGSVVEASTGDLIVSGQSFGLGTGTPNFMLSKFNSSGTEQWTKSLGGTGTDNGHRAIESADGGYVMVGDSTSTGVAGSTDIMLSKFNSSGVEQWTQTLGGTAAEAGNSVALTGDGGFIVAGSTASFGVTGTDILLAKFDSSGTEQWTKTLGSAGTDSASSALQTSDGGYIVTGSYNTNYLILAKFDSSGVEQWSKTYGLGSGSNSGSAIMQTSDGGYAVAATTSDNGAGSNDMVFAKFGAAGETPGCSTGCAYQTISEVDQSPTLGTPSYTEEDQGLTPIDPDVTESTVSSTEDYFMDRGLWTELAAIPSSPIGSQDTAGASTRHDDPLRLRAVLDPTKASTAASASLKLQVAARVGTCDTSFTGETYADISGSTFFNYYDSGSLADGDWPREGGFDPTVTGTLYYENYEESANFANRHYLPGSGFGLWDISLNPTDNAVYGSYCFRVVHSSNTLLNGYTRIYELSIPPAPSQQMRHGRFFDTNTGTAQPIYW